MHWAYDELVVPVYYTNPRQFFVTFIYRYTLMHRFYHRIIINYTYGVVYILLWIRSGRELPSFLQGLKFAQICQFWQFYA